MTETIKAWAVQHLDGTIGPRVYAMEEIASIMAGSVMGGAIGEFVPVVVMRAEDFREESWKTIDLNPPPHGRTVLLGWHRWNDGEWMMEVNAYHWTPLDKQMEFAPPPAHIHPTEDDGE